MPFFQLYTDASIVGLGVVLLQDGHPIAFESRKLNPAERNYPVHELELLAIVHAVRTFRHYLQGCKHFTLFTDHHSLQHFFNQPTLSSRQAHWALDFADYQPNMTITYKPGPYNQADALSMLVGQTLASVNLLFTQFTLSNNLLIVDIKAAYSADSYYKSPPSFLTSTDGLYYFKDRICVPANKSLRLRILQECHDTPSAGHPGFIKTLANVAQRFWWPHLSKTVRSYVTSCATCQRIKPSTQHTPGLLHSQSVPTRPWSHISMDLVTDLPLSLGPDGLSYDSICTFVCLLTKQAFFVCCNKTITANNLAHLFIDNVYRLQGLPSKIISDHETRITSDFWQTLFSQLGSHLNISTAYHPQTDGQSERTHRTIEQILRAYVMMTGLQGCRLLNLPTITPHTPPPP